MFKPLAFLALTVALLLAAAAKGEDKFYTVSAAKIAPAQAPPTQPATRPDRDELGGWVTPRVVVEGAGEGVWVPPGFTAGQSWWPGSFDDTTARQGRIALRAPGDAGEVRGRLYWPKPDGTGMAAVPFAVPASEATPEARALFLNSRAAYYQSLASGEGPGQAWFRHQARSARLERGGDEAAEDARLGRPDADSGDELDGLLDLFGGGQAVSENLQLERDLRPGPATRPAERNLDAGAIPGITVAPMDWKPLLAGLGQVATDPLAAAIPADQHAVFFPSFAAFTDVLDEAKKRGGPLTRFMEPGSDDAAVLARYETQLALPLSGLARVLGPRVIGGVALTGGDPYFRSGTDVAVLFEAADAAALESLLLAQMKTATQGDPEVRPLTGEAAGTRYAGVRSPDRRVCAYLARVGAAVVATNSEAQLTALAAVAAGKAPAVASLDEYRYFRGRYRRGEAGESALVFLGDPAIRRWCGPRWRIGTARRALAEAALGEMQARHLAGSVRGGPASKPTDLVLPGDDHAWKLGDDGVSSSTYGRLGFLTPIHELPFDKITASEKAAYERWRDSYQQNWRWAFDPIALRLSVRPDRTSADLTVMPLIASSEYRPFVELTRGVKIAPDAGDPHDALFHVVLAVNREAETIQEHSRELVSFLPGLKVDPLAWLGRSVALYVDDDPFWGELATRPAEERENPEGWFGRLPIGLRAEVSDALKLTGFLAALRGAIEGSAPELSEWETLRHGDQPYVRVRGTEASRGMIPPLAVYYAATPDALLVTLNEGLLKRALDRRAARKGAQTRPAAATAPRGNASAPGSTQPASAWLGESMAARLDGRVAGLMALFQEGEGNTAFRDRAWATLPILNEWKRLFPAEDPVALHERFWHESAAEPAGGRFVWNERDATMESTIYGHPGAPKQGPKMPPWPPGLFDRAGFGISFEDQGLRARLELERAAGTP